VLAVHSRYQDIASSIRERIEAGEWEPGSRLPRLDDFAKEYEANRNTIGRAIAELEIEGYVWAVQGRGIAVRHGAIRPRRTRGDLVKRNQQALGYSFPSASGQEVWVRHGDSTSEPTRLSDPRLAKLLGVTPGTLVLRRHRVTSPAGEEPFQISTSWIHPRVEDLVTGVDAHPAAGEWLYLIEKGGHWPIEWHQITRARMPGRDEASLLQIPTTLPIMEIVRVGYSGADQKPVEVTEQIIPGDRVEVFGVLRRDESALAPWPDDDSPTIGPVPRDAS
jgi:DNA-binding GntR family transcriptional regulator